MSRKLLLLNGLAAMMIPLHHSTAFGLQAMFNWTNRYRDVTVPNFDQLGSGSYYLLMAARQLDAFAIPTFLFVSGFFLAFIAKGDSKNVSLSEVLPRIKVLLIPFLLWSVVRFGLLMRPPTSVFEFIDQYYYIVLLFQLYLLAPILVPLAKRNWPLLLITTGALMLAVEGIELMNAIGVQSTVLDALRPINPRWLFAGKLFSFALGLVIGLHAETAKAWLSRNRRWLLVGVVVSLALTMVEYEVLASWSGKAWLGPNNPGISRIVYAGLFAPCVLAFGDNWLPYKRHISDVGSKSLGIYLANIPFGYAAASMMHRFTPSLLGVQLAYQTVLVIIGLFGPLMMMEIVRRSPLRRYYRFVFG